MSKYFEETTRILVIIFFCLCLIGSAFLTGEREEDQCNSTGLARSINDFGNSLTNLIGGTNNTFISPFGIYVALAMTYLGARGETAQQMEEAFQLASHGVSGEQLHELFQNLIESFRNDQEEYDLLLANALFIQQTFNVNPNYVRDAQSFYRAKVESVDFAHQGEEAKAKINTFVAENTNNKISQFLPAPLSADTIMALFNVIYFKGIWKTEFPVNQTRKRTFYQNLLNSKKVEFMQLRNVNFSFYQDFQLNYKFLELPYKGNDVSMLLVMPFHLYEFPNFKMTSSELCRIKKHFQKVNMTEVMLPKIQLEFEKELKPILEQLGISHLFDGSADLSGITAEGGIKVSSVLHKAVIEVDEQGSEAAAATQVEIDVISVLSVNEFRADHPFQLYIVDNTNGLILFSGLVTGP